MRPRIQVDPNEHDRDGFLITRAEGVEESAVVVAYEPEDRLEWDALVVEVRGSERNIVALHMNWESVREY